MNVADFTAAAVGKLASALSALDSLVLLLLPAIVVAYIFFGLDDLLIDLVAWLARLRPRELRSAELERMRNAPQKRIAIVVASWMEMGVLGNMVRGNCARIRYDRYDFFLGVYPNDAATGLEAAELAKTFPHVHVVTNSKDGPTSKGQMLNEVVRAIFEHERRRGTHFDAILIQDSEDVIHPEALTVVNWELERADLVQIPVFSLPVARSSLVAGTYVDEFSELHTKDILVRSFLDLCIPTAGVGTAVSRKLVNAYANAQGGDLLNQLSMTEDYELGVSTAFLGAGYRSSFACYFLRSGDQRDFIATREYFPRSLARSVRQKTRWTYGIAVQGTIHLGWRGSPVHKYFLYRDRKAPFTSVLVIAGYVLVLYALTRSLPDAGLPFLGFAATTAFMFNRIAQRMYCVSSVYGLGVALLVPVRLPVGNVINALAACRALVHLLGVVTGKAVPRWPKTEHELPEGFGMDVGAPASPASEASASPAHAEGPSPASSGLPGSAGGGSK